MAYDRGSMHMLNDTHDSDSWLTTIRSSVDDQVGWD